MEYTLTTREDVTLIMHKNDVNFNRDLRQNDATSQIPVLSRDVTYINSSYSNVEISIVNLARKGTFDTSEQEHRWAGQYTPEVDI